MRLRRSGAVLAGVLLAASAINVMQIPAQAEIVCYPTHSQTKAYVYCTGTTTRYRATAQCQDPQHGSTGIYYGPLVRSPSTSSLTCPFEGGFQWLIVPPTTYQFA